MVKSATLSLRVVLSLDPEDSPTSQLSLSLTMASDDIQKMEA